MYIQERRLQQSSGMPELELDEVVAFEAGVHGRRRAHDGERAPRRVHLPRGDGVLDTTGAHGHGLRRGALQLLAVLPGHGRGGRAGEPLHEVAELPGLHAVHLGRRRRGRQACSAPRLGRRLLDRPERRLVAGDGRPPHLGPMVQQMIH